MLEPEQVPAVSFQNKMKNRDVEGHVETESKNEAEEGDVLSGPYAWVQEQPALAQVTVSPPLAKICWPREKP